ncbi:hypothetical protein BHM03_00046434, partial [Ensete ventricosum]
GPLKHTSLLSCFVCSLGNPFPPPHPLPPSLAREEKAEKKEESFLDHLPNLTRPNPNLLDLTRKVNQDVVTEQAPRDGPDEAVHLQKKKKRLQSDSTGFIFDCVFVSCCVFSFLLVFPHRTEYCQKYAKHDDEGASSEEKSSEEEPSADEYDSSDEQVVGKPDP